MTNALTRWTVRAILVAALASPITALAQKTDIVVMQNGDHVTCEIKRLDRGRLKIGTDHMGDIYIEWDKVRSISTSRVFEVETVSGVHHYGPIRPGSREGTLIVETAGGDVELEHSATVYLIKIGESFVKRLEGSIDFGFNLARANDERRYVIAGDVAYRGRSSLTTASLHSSVSERTDTRGTDRHRVDFQYRRFNVYRTWDVVGSAAAERNTQLDLELRNLLTFSVERTLVKTNSNLVLIGLGASFNNETYGDANRQSDSAEGTATANYEYFNYSPLLIDFSLSLNLFPSLTESGRYRFEGQARYRNEIVKDLFISLRAWYSYDSKPPTESSDGQDWAIETSLGWTF